MLHVDYFHCSLTEKGRSRLVEEPTTETTSVGESLLVLASVERQDEEDHESVSMKAAEEIVKLAHQLKVETIVIHPFAHLFGELSKPETAMATLKLMEKNLRERGLNVVRTPFGWFNTIELRAKGHPLSRVARQITANQTPPSEPKKEKLM